MARELVDWTAVARRNSRSVQTTVGWIFWEPGAIARYESLGLPGQLGYIASRAAPIGPAGADATIAAFGSISPLGIRAAFELVAARTTFREVWDARNDAVLEGLAAHAPAILEPLASLGALLWPVVESLPGVGKILFAATRSMPRPDDAVLSGWLAINALREWRGDLHWALVASAGLSGIEASILHNAWLGYERDWLPRSRSTAPEDLARAWESLRLRGLARDTEVTSEGIALRQRLEDDTDRLGIVAWQLLGETEANRFASTFEPPCAALLARVDLTAGPNYQPASRVRAASLD